MMWLVLLTVPKRHCDQSGLLLIPAEDYMKSKLLIAAVLVAILAASSGFHLCFQSTWVRHNIRFAIDRVAPIV